MCTKAGSSLRRQAPDDGAVGVGEGEHLVGPRSEELAGLVGGAGDDEGHPAVGLAEVERAPGRRCR